MINRHAIAAVSASSALALFLASCPSRAATIGDPCMAGIDCVPLNGGCISSAGAYLDGSEGEIGTCRGGDSDECVNVASGPVTGGDCTPDYSCQPCDVDLFGPSTCHCQCDEDMNCGPPCAASVCVPAVDACSLYAGYCWDPNAQTCGVCGG